MKIKLFYLLTTLIYLAGCKESSYVPKEVHKWNNNISAESNIVSNAIFLNDSIDFSFLENIVKDKRVIILGEQFHVDETSTKVKVELIQELQKYGFNTVALEVAPLLCWYAYNDPQLHNIISDWDIKNMYIPSYFEHDGFKPFAEMIENREIKAFGMDTHLRAYDFDVAENIIDSYSTGAKFNFNWSRMKQLHYMIFNSATLSEQKEYMSMANDIRNQIDYIIEMNGTSAHIEAVKQWLRNVDEVFDRASSEIWNRKDSGYIPPAANQMRDTQMAENVMWYMNQFPDEKIIIWVANFHGAKDISQTEYRPGNLDYYYYWLLGENLHNHFGDELYSIAFTSLNQSIENFYPPGKLENTISDAANNSPYAFIDFEDLRFQDGYRNVSFEASLIRKKTGKWLNIFDGLFYIKDLKIYTGGMPKEMLEPRKL